MSTGRIAYLDCSSGISGDKFLGALLDAGTASGEFTAEHLQATVTGIAPEAIVEVERVDSHGISATGVRIMARSDSPHRRWRDIETLLADAALPDEVRANALRTFEALAVAEAAVHGVDVADVHFHEVGAIDSIADVVGVCAGMHALGIGTLVATPVAVGSGTIESSHGLLPVPAPATAMLLAEAPAVGGPVVGELTTPTGAALLKGLSAHFGDMPQMLVAGVGRGAGTRDIGIPNVCQLMLGAAPDDGAAQDLGLETVVVLQTNIDHISAEELAHAAEQLLEAGALDVWQTPIVMKKGRAAIELGVLATPDDARRLTGLAIALTGSLGIRHQRMERTRANRESSEIATKWGPVRIKSGAGRVRPEHEDVARIAREHALDYAVVVHEILRTAEEEARS